ncbi:MAG: ABC transporter ATP-binding protein [Candidatus Pelethousia sp.]|nr:ABC transporter ATP-binding protein [Candidatus Pelethousia sp.]
MITVKGLQKEFKDFHALKNVDMHVKKGEIYGFIGHNGAGKSTALNILAGLSHPTKGECTVNGRNIAEIKHPGDVQVGYLPEDPRFYPWMTAYEMLEYLGDGINRRRIVEMLEWVGLADASHRRVGGFSRGMKQRLGIGAALIREPALLILDEPSSALDPEGRSEVLRLIKELKSMGKTILFSTHILDDVERVCDTVGMVDAGQMMFEKPLAQLQKENTQPIFDVTPVHSVESNILDALERLTGVVSLTKSEKSLTIKVADNTVSVSVMRFLADHEIVIKSFSLRKTRLEDLFLRG